MRGDFRFLLLLGCFFLSGFAGLLYETAWTRQFAFVFGTSELAVVTVLAAYFGGLTAGASLSARFGRLVRRPVLAYGLIELGIAVTALGVPAAIHVATRLYVHFFGGQAALPEAAGLTTALFYLVCSFVILLIPTALMGATLPLLAGHAVRAEDQVGPRVGWLYAVNTFGAVAGTVFTAFVLLPRLGLGHTVWVGVGVNGLVFVGAVLLARGSARVSPASESPSVSARGGGGLILPLIFLSGAVAFTYEVLWTRLLGHILGGSVYAFATMLASFLLGIAAGSAIATRSARNLVGAARAFGWAQIGTAVLAMAAFAAVNHMPAFARWVGAGATSGPWVNALVAGLILLPSAVCIGATFPLAVRVLARDAVDAGPASGRVYAWNTIGAILGALAAGFIILPTLNYGGTVTLAVGINLGLAAVIGFWPSFRDEGAPGALRRIGLVATGGLAVLAALALTAIPGEPWKILRNSALRSGSRLAQGHVAYYGVGRSATVLMIGNRSDWTLRTNGLQESVIRRPSAVDTMVTAPWLTALPALARPNARSLLAVGLGGGVFLERTPASLTSIHVVEIEPDVLAANRSISGKRAINPLTDPRVHVCLNDARAAMMLTPSRYDIIVSQPSHPWTAGASHLYTREFFDLVRDHLTADGVFVQWMGLSFIDEALAKSLVATLGDVFAHVRVYRPTNMKMLFLASAEPLPLEQAAARTLIGGAEEFAPMGIALPEDLGAALVMDEQAARRFSTGAPLITDDVNRLEMNSPRAMRHKRSPSDWDAVFNPYTCQLDLDWAKHRRYLVRRIIARHNLDRATAVAESNPDPADRSICLGWVALARGERDAADELFRSALKHDPGSSVARYGVVWMHRDAYLKDDAEIVGIAEDANDLQRAVFEGWRLSSGPSWRKLRRLEPRLAAARRYDDCWAEAIRLRAQWRVRSREPRLGKEAISMLDLLPTQGRASYDLILRVRAALFAADTVGVLSTLGALHKELRPTVRGKRTARVVLKLLESLPDDKDTAASRRRLRRRAMTILERDTVRGKGRPR